MDAARFGSGRWFVLAQGVLVSAFGIAGLVSATLHPHAGPTGAPVLGLASTPAHSAILLGFGLGAIASVSNRRAAVTITALSAVAYTVLLFFSSVATARTKPTPLGFHAADIVLHGVLAVVNLALLMWLIPDELGDEAWVWRRRRGVGRARRQPSTPEAVTEPATASTNIGSTTKLGPPPAAAAGAQDSGAYRSPPALRGQASRPGSTNPPVSVWPVGRKLPLQSGSQETDEPSVHNVDNPTQLKHFAARAMDAVIAPGGVVAVAVAVLAVVIGIFIWIRRR